jgi:hypothetical protein
MFDHTATTLTAEEVRLGESFQAVMAEHGLKFPMSFDETDNVRTEDKPYAMIISILVKKPEDQQRVLAAYSAWKSANFPSKSDEELNSDGLIITMMERIRVGILGEPQAA